MVVALTIAGSDSIGGAGIQADIKALASMGVHAASVITCVTSQNTQKVSAIFALPIEHIISQLDAVLEDAKIDSVKMGMLYSSTIARSVVERLEREMPPLVVDPVLAAGVGDSLHRQDLIRALKERVIPIATCITPNKYEAEMLTGQPINNLKEAKRACRTIAKLGARSVLLKGGHFDGDVVTDLLFLEGDFLEIKSPRIKVKPHGSGCNLSAFITGYLALGTDVRESVIAARSRIADSIEGHYKVGRGLEIVNSMATLEREALRYQVLNDLKDGVAELEGMLRREWVPEVGINFAYALPNARYYEDVCALEGRIVKVGGKVGHVGCLAYGVSRHVARIVLTIMRFDEGKRAALNLRYSEENLAKLKGLEMKIASYDRAKEPKGVRTMEWGTESAIKEIGFVPDVIFDRGGVGKEAMIRIVGKSPQDILSRIRKALD